MSQELLGRGLMAAILSVIFTRGIFSRYHEESSKENEGENNQKYLPYIPGNLLPVCILAVAVFGLFSYGIRETAQLMISVCFGVFLHISIYYAVLILMIPFLRKYISARTCAVLWLLPNYLYIVFYSFMDVDAPLLVVHAPQNLVWLLFGIWLAGFFTVFFGNVISHLVFRKNLLRGAKEITDEETLQIWNEKLNAANMKYKKYRLMVSGNAKTPLSVGLYRRSICVVLPEKKYSPEELGLIFRHEIIHIGREDNWSKFFLLLCTSICWFHPFMWIAMRKSADDLELSCDETVLLDADDEDRQRYAKLILNTAGDERGFTTCLSASAAALRYRLKNIMRIRLKKSGIVLVGILFLVLFISYGYVGLAYGETTGKETIYQSKDPKLYKLDQLYMREQNSGFRADYECVNDEALSQYLSELQMENIAGKYKFFDSEKELYITYQTLQGNAYITLYDHVIKIMPPYDEDAKLYTYYLSEPTDWEKLEQLIVGYPAMTVVFFGENAMEPMKLPASVMMIKKIEAGKSTILYEYEVSEGDVSGLYHNRSYDRMILKFSEELVSECNVEITSWEGVVQETISVDVDGQELEISMAEYPARYHVNASFLGRNQEIYEVDFLFNIGE